MAARRGGRGAVLALLVLVVLGAGAWVFRDYIPGLGSRTHTEVSAAAAASAEEKLNRLRDGDTARLSGAEVTSYLRYRGDGVLAGLFHEPDVRFEGDQVRVGGRFPTEHLPDAPELDRARGFLPDTADVDVRGRLRPLPGGRMALRMESASFARIPIPREMYGRVFERLGRTDEPGLGPDEYPFALPPEVGGATIEDGMLVLVPSG